MGLAEKFVKQCSKPEGLLGRFVGRAMNVGHGNWDAVRFLSWRIMLRDSSGGSCQGGLESTLLVHYTTSW
jgi:hypothetical protein